MSKPAVVTVLEQQPRGQAQGPLSVRVGRAGMASCRRACWMRWKEASRSGQMEMGACTAGAHSRCGGNLPLARSKISKPHHAPPTLTIHSDHGGGRERSGLLCRRELIIPGVPTTAGVVAAIGSARGVRQPTPATGAEARRRLEAGHVQCHGLQPATEMRSDERAPAECVHGQLSRGERRQEEHRRARPARASQVQAPAAGTFHLGRTAPGRRGQHAVSEG